MYEVRKINKRLVIACDGRVVYSMPWWVRVTDRSNMQWLADRFNAAGTDDITAIMEFESRHSAVGKRGQRVL